MKTKKETIRKIAPPDDWKKKVVKGRGWNLKDIEARAEQAISALQADFLPTVRRDLAAVDKAVAQAQSSVAGEREQALQRVHQVAHDVRGQAGTFGYDLITTIGASLCNYIEEAGNIDTIHLKVIEIHVDAMRAVIANDIRGDGGDIGRQLLIGMKQMVEKTLATDGSRGRREASAAQKAKRAAS